MFAIVNGAGDLGNKMPHFKQEKYQEAKKCTHWKRCCGGTHWLPFQRVTGF